MIEVKIASEIQEKDFPLRNGGLLCVSQSGETTDLLGPFRQAEKLGIKRFNIVNSVESTLAREAKCGVFLNAGKETSIASTKAFLNQVIAFSLITLWFSSRHNYKNSKAQRVKLWTELTLLSQKVKTVVESIPEFAKACASKLKDESSVFLLGLGLGECVAKEGSLKLKELTYKHCQAYSLNNVANGFFSYSKERKEKGGAYAFHIILEDEFKERNLEFLQYIDSKLGVNAFVISDCQEPEDRAIIEAHSKQHFYVPQSGYLSALLCIIPIQLSAFETTYALGRNPDNPRSLTKVVL